MREKQTQRDAAMDKEELVFTTIEDLIRYLGECGEEVKEYASEKAKEDADKETCVTTASTESTSSTVKPAKTEETASKEKKKVKVPVGSLVLMILISFGAIGAYVYKKIGKQNKKDDRPDSDADYREGEEEDYLDEMENGDEGESTQDENK